MAERTLVTCALPYVNNVPHLGNLIPILSADVHARYLRLIGANVIYICATDEHGTRTEIEAECAGLTPAEWCERLHTEILESFHWFNVRFDHFGRTSSPANHELTQDIFKHLDANGFVLEDDIEQLFCATCGHFLPDTYVSGTCPICRTPGASGDQCDACGHFMDPLSLIDPSCKTCSSTPVSRHSHHLFLDLPALAPAIREWVETKTSWDESLRNVPLGWIKDGLKPRCITRDLSWGVKVPKPGFENKVFYVWFDAPIGYVAATSDWADASGTDWQGWWKNPTTRIVHFLGKDNIPFHTLMWPGSLIGADDGWNLPDHIAANEYLTYEGAQFSKSRGRGIFSSDARTLPFAPDVWRFALMSNRPEKKDVDFSWEGFLHATNSDLVGNLGNFAYRTLTFLKKQFGQVPEAGDHPDDVAAIARAGELAEKIGRLYGDYRLRDAAATLLELGDHGNITFHRNEPWVLIKTDKERCAGVMHAAARILAQLSWAMAPMMPDAARAIRTQLGVDDTSDVWVLDPPIAGNTIAPPAPLFAKMDPEIVSELVVRFGGKSAASELPPLSYSIDTSIDYQSLVVELSGLTVRKKHAKLEKLKRETVAALDLAEHRTHAALEPYLRLLETRDLGGRAPSALNLIDIVERAGKLPTINTLVDAYNLQSLKHATVMGAYDRRALTGNLRMKVADGNEHFVPVAGRDPEPIRSGEWVIVDEEDRVVTKIVSKQSEAVAVTIDTTAAAMCIQGNPAIGADELRKITIETCEIIQRICGGTWRIVNEG